MKRVLRREEIKEIREMKKSKKVVNLKTVVEKPTYRKKKEV